MVSIGRGYLDGVVVAQREGQLASLFEAQRAKVQLSRPVREMHLQQKLSVKSLLRSQVKINVDRISGTPANLELAIIDMYGDGE